MTVEKTLIDLAGFDAVETSSILKKSTRRIKKDVFEIRYTVKVPGQSSNQQMPVSEAVSDTIGNIVTTIDEDPVSFNRRKTRVYREIALAECPIDLSGTFMTDTEFMDIITGKTGAKKTHIYQRKPYSTFMRNYIQSLYEGDAKW